MAITKIDLIEMISEKISLQPSKAKHSFEIFLEIMKSTLASGEDIMISGFGKFQVHQKKQRKGRNPVNGKTMMLKERSVVTFKCAGALRDKINGDKD